MSMCRYYICYSAMCTFWCVLIQMAVIAMTFSWVRHDPVSDMTGYNLKYCPVFMCRPVYITHAIHVLKNTIS